MNMKLTTSGLKYKDLFISPKELRLDTLKCGQSFRWKLIDNHWVSVLKGKLVILKETPVTILYSSTLSESEIREYFQLDKVSLSACYQRWSEIDPNFAKKALHFQGIRMLRQDPWENLVSFICSSNNNITRISQMVDKLCTTFGTEIGSVNDQPFYDFPSLDVITQDNKTEQVLRELGFGYRAKYIAKTAQKIKLDYPDLKEKWLHTLRDVPYAEAKKKLMELQGVGPKVADCVCLMSLDHTESIPVDTHVWQIATRDYGFNKKKKTSSLTSKLYIEVGDHFRLLFGDYSGWAHSVLFTADLKSFSKQEELKGKRRLSDALLVKEESKKVKIEPADA